MILVNVKFDFNSEDNASSKLVNNKTSSFRWMFVLWTREDSLLTEAVQVVDILFASSKIPD